MAKVLLSSLLGAYYYRTNPVLRSIEPWANLGWRGLCSHSALTKSYQPRDPAVRTEARDTTRANRAENRERINELKRAYHAKNREQINTRQRANSAKNREHINERYKANAAKNREHVNELHRANAAKHREGINERQRARRAVKKAQQT